MGGNEDGRGNGERLAVDPDNGKILYFGSRHAGLWRSTDGAATWSKVTTFPDVTESLASLPRPGTLPSSQPGRRSTFMPRSSGIVFVIFDSRNSTIYAGVSLLNRPSLFQSADAGQTWQPVPSQPTNLRPSHGVLASNGVIYLSYGSAPGPSRMTRGAIWKFDTTSAEWTDITPDKPDPRNGRTFGYGAVSVDAANPNALIASTFGYPQGEELFRSTDSGKTWKPIFRGGGIYDHSAAPYTSHTPIHWLLDIQIDPCNPNHAMFTTGYGGWETFDLTNVDIGKPTHWSIFSKGIEETVALQLISPPVGAHLISAIGDYGGFVHWNLDAFAPEGNFDHPHFGNTTGIAFASKRPETIVRVGQASGGQSGGFNIGYSTDGGKTWQPPKSMPQSNSAQGRISVNSDGTRWIWTPQRSAAYLSSDSGTTWTLCHGLPDNLPTVADSVNPMKFYAVDLLRGESFRSIDGGRTFESTPLNLPGVSHEPGADRGDDRGGQDQIYTTPDIEGDLWIAAFEGLYHSNDGGQNFTGVDGPTNIRAFGFGKAAPRETIPAIFAAGTIGNQEGIFRSDNGGKNWLRINDNQHQYGLILQLAGDPRVYGRVYVGTHGRGILYADPAD
jgi:photosystem II stability/assembly factor-like uncharacterized protein